MEPPPPLVTITGGFGWTQDSDARETLDGATDEDVGVRPGRARHLTALLLAAALGFGVSSLLAERRQSALERSPEGVLSLDLSAQGATSSSDLVASADGPAVVIDIVLRNTGPRTITLQAAKLDGTGFAADDLAGRRMGPDRNTSVRLIRPIRCDDLAPLGPVGPLQVRATTGAGTRDTELRIETQGIASTVDVAAAACGRTGPGQSLLAVDTPPDEVVGDRAQAGFELSSASRLPLLVQSLQVPPGLRLVELRHASGGKVTLPLRLAPGDYDPPTSPMDGRGPAQRLIAVLEVTDCAAIPERTQDQMYEPLFRATVTDERDSSESGQQGDFAGTVSPSWGDIRVMDRLRDNACPLRTP